MSIIRSALGFRILLTMPLWFGGVLGCASAAQPVHFTDEWPSQVSDYEDTTAQWTRRGVLRAPLEEQASQVLELYATYLSVDWRAAYVARQSSLQKMSGERRQQLEAEQKELARNSHQFELLVTTYDPQHNDLHREKSIWRATLVDEDGNEIAAQKIEKDRRPRQVISSEFKDFGDFSEAYRVTFPHSPAILGGKKFSLRVSSSLGMVEVQWVSQDR